MNDALIKFKEVVGRSRTISVRVGETTDMSKILCGAVLNKILEKLEKKTTLDISFAPQNTKNAARLLLDLREEKLNQAPSAKENILLKFDLKSLPIKELKYEKDGDQVKVILESEDESAELDVSKIRVEKETVPVDLLLLIDPPEQKVEKMILRNPHKEVVKIGAHGKNLPLKILELTKLFLDEIPQGIAETLWFLTGEEARVSNPVSKESLEAALELGTRNLNHEMIAEAREALFGNSFLRLLGRALARSHYEKGISTTWSVLAKSDFEKTNKDSGSLLSILQNLRALNPYSKFCALLWATEKDNVSAFVAGADSEKLRELSSLFATSPASSYFLVNSFLSFSEAEIKIRNSIRKIG